VKTTPRRVDKPWGYELIWAETDAYLGKILHVRAGEALSLQRHELKDETLFLLSGEVVVSAGPAPESLARIDLRVGESVRVRPGIVHRIEAVSDSELLEASTPHIDDVVRLEDRYGRATGRAAPP